MKEQKTAICVILVVLVLTIGGIIVYKAKSKPKEATKVEEKMVTNSRFLYLKANSLVKVTYEEKYKTCGSKVCSNIENKITNVEFLNEEAKTLYSGVSLVNEELYSGIKKLIEKNTEATKVEFYYNSENFDKKLVNVSSNIETGYFNVETVDEEKLKENVVFYKVTYINESETKEEVVEEGKTVTNVYKPTKEGYEFVEWQLDGKKFDFTTPITKDIALKAVWKKVETKQEDPNAPTKYAVSFNSDGGGMFDKQFVESGKTATKPSDPYIPGYTFVEWQLNGKGYDFNSPVTKNIVLKAVYKKNEVSPTPDPTPTPTLEKYTVTFNSDGGSSVTSQTIESGNKVTKPSNPTKSGYTFAEWQLNGRTYDFNTAVTSNIELKAVWNQKTYTIRAIAVDKYSPDRILHVYEDGNEIVFREIKYTDGTLLCYGVNPTVSVSDIEGETTFKVVLNGGTEVSATLS